MATILIVEDEEALAWVVTHCLRKAGHTPIVAATGAAALRDARMPPDLILLDLGLPDLSGAEVLRRLQATPETARIPVVIASGQLDAAAVVAESGTRAVAAILRKPLQLPQLCAVVAAVLRAPAEWEEWAGQRRGQVLYRLITEGSNRLVHQVCRRLEADRPGGPPSSVAPAPSWADLVHAAKGEGLLSDAEKRVLAAGPVVLGASR